MCVSPCAWLQAPLSSNGPQTRVPLSPHSCQRAHTKTFAPSSPFRRVPNGTSFKRYQVRQTFAQPWSLAELPSAYVVPRLLETMANQNVNVLTEWLNDGPNVTFRRDSGYQALVAPCLRIPERRGPLNPEGRQLRLSFANTIPFAIQYSHLIRNDKAGPGWVSFLRSVGF